MQINPLVNAVASLDPVLGSSWYGLDCACCLPGAHRAALEAEFAAASRARTCSSSSTAIGSLALTLSPSPTKQALPQVRTQRTAWARALGDEDASTEA